MSGARYARGMTGAPKRKRVLVAEDDPAIRKLLQTALASRYDVDVAEDGTQALAILARTPPPDLLLCDVMMPGIDGVTVAKRAKQSAATKHIPIIFLTAKTGSLDVIAGIQAGAKHYIAKPFLISDVLAKIAKVLGV